MADIINFPDENKRLLENGNKRLEEQDFLAAKKDFTRLYQQNSTFFYAKKLVAALWHLGEYSNALQLADDHFTAFMNDAEGFIEYFHLLLLDTQFLAAHKLLHYSKKTEKTAELRNELAQLEDTQSLLSNDIKMAKKKQLAQLDKQKKPVPPQEWQALVKEITLDGFLSMCQVYLPEAQNPFIPPKLIEELVQIGAVGEVVVNHKTINLEDLPLPEEAKVLQKILAIVDEKVQDYPQLNTLIVPEIKAHFAFMYPFLPDVEQAMDWAESYILEYKAMFGEEVSDEKWEYYRNIQEKKQEIRQIYQEIGTRS
ncbi:hypothetical protein C7K38_09905 [Tetragenococcus osmophilus]|uniref:Hydrolase n=1 Tax=Tetragenococcus osmophilus TaxID=526944 RepID=A0ABN5QYS7_9ENTE|nr:hypothetical protein [Tetragenococcus osmophilus]AYW48658.1 hypothetical protein C7K38_09905 [Tetragenococcus osmophilus]